MISFRARAVFRLQVWEIFAKTIFVFTFYFGSSKFPIIVNVLKDNFLKEKTFKPKTTTHPEGAAAAPELGPLPHHHHISRGRRRGRCQCFLNFK